MGAGMNWTAGSATTVLTTGTGLKATGVGANARGAGANPKGAGFWKALLKGETPKGEAPKGEAPKGALRRTCGSASGAPRADARQARTTT